MAADEFMQEFKVPVPKGGMADGLDPALENEDYPATFSPDMENVRVGFGRWDTRLGTAVWMAMPGSGDVRLLETISLADGSRYRLLGRGNTTGGAFYDFQVGTDTAFQTTSGGTGLGSATEPYWQGVVLNDMFYFTDRVNGLKRYSPAAGVAAVTQPAAPSAAPGVKARPAAYLDSWNGNAGVAPFGWTESSNADYAITDATATDPNPLSTRTVKLAIKTTAVGTTITENVASEAINSDSIAYWLKQERERFHQQFEIGINAAGDLLNVHDRAPSADEWTPVFMNTRGLAAISYKRFKVLHGTVKNDYVSALVLPGRLAGQYRWIYTHYDPATGNESEPSAVSNSNAPLDFTVEGVTGNHSTTAAFNKACALNFTSDSGTNAATTKIRIYRNGGTPDLITDDQGHEVWYRVGEVYDKSTTLSNSPAAAATSFTLTSATNVVAGDLLVLKKASATEEYVTVLSVAGSTINLTEPLIYAHVSGESCQTAYLDNTPNEAVDVSTPIMKERDDAPTGCKWVARSPDGRLWLFGPNTKVAVSNRSTPDKPTDYEVFPDGVDPLTRRSLIQGWRFEVGGDTTDEQIMWGGFYNGLATVLTRRHLYQIQAYSQADWGPSAIQKVLDVGCLSGDTVQEVNGALYWVADGPRVMRWDGHSAPECISHERLNQTLDAAPSAYWNLWFAQYHAKLSGKYYCLYMVPTGATTPTKRLDYNAENGAWEPVVYYDAGGTALSHRAAMMLDGGSDAMELYQAASDGNIYQAETGSTDNGHAITIRFSTKKFPLNSYVGMLHTFLCRLSAVTDTVTLTVTAGGSEYGQQSQAYTLTLSGSNDIELYQRLHRTLIGRWVQFTISGTVSNRPAFRDLVLRWLPLRSAHYKR